MGLTIVTLAALTGVAAVLIIERTEERPSPVTTCQRSRAIPTSPLDEAERILATRYAKGEITSDEYSRMLSILRR